MTNQTVTKFTMEQAIVITGYTGCLACPWVDFHADVEKRLGYPVFSHQFGNKTFAAEIAKVYREDFLAMALDREETA